MANPYFNAAYYVQNNPDILTGGFTEATAEQHYIRHGAEEALNGAATRKPAPWFDIQYYLETYPDLQENGITAATAFEHFANHGIKEKRVPAEGGALTEAALLAYAKASPDLLAAFEVAEDATTLNDAQIEGLTSHFYMIGWSENRDAKPVEIDGGTGVPSTLTAALENLAAAEAGVAEALEAAAEAVNAAATTPLEGDALEDYVAQFDEDQLEAAVEAAEESIDVERNNVEQAEANLSAARLETFAAATDAVQGTGVATAAGNLVTAELATGTARLTDANISAVVAAAQRNVNTDTALYKNVAGDDVTARALQIEALNAAAAVQADVSANGSNAALLTQLRTAIANYVEAGGDTATALVNEDSSTYADLAGLLTEINTALATAGADAREAAAQAIVEVLVGTDGTDAVPVELGTPTAGVDSALVDAIDAVLEKAHNRGELYAAEDETAQAFDASTSGGLLNDALVLSAAREALDSAVTNAEGDLAEAQDLFDALSGLQADYDAAVENLEEAQQYFVDNDLELPVAVDGSVTASADNDIFMYVEEAGTILGFSLEGDDVLFVGSQSFTWTVLEADDNLATERLGDAELMEVFAQQVGNNVVLSFEQQAFAGSALNLDDIVQVTLTGVSVEDLTLTSDGFIIQA